MKRKEPWNKDIVEWGRATVLEQIDKLLHSPPPEWSYNQLFQVWRQRDRIAIFFEMPRTRRPEMPNEP